MWIFVSRERIPYRVTDESWLWTLSKLPGTPRLDHLQALAGVGKWVVPAGQENPGLGAPRCVTDTHPSPRRRISVNFGLCCPV